MAMQLYQQHHYKIITQLNLTALTSYGIFNDVIFKPMRFALLCSSLLLLLMATMKAQAQTDASHANTHSIVRVAPNSLQKVQLSFAHIAQKTLPAVVNIFTRQPHQKRNLLNHGGMFQFFFPEMLQQQVEPRYTLGSGVIVSKHKLVITNHHVIEGANEILATLDNGRQYALRLVLSDLQTDIAILAFDDAIDKSNLLSIPFANKDSLKVGDIVLAIGNPFGIGQTVTLGIASGLERTAPGFSNIASFIQTDASINPGNSGGALIDIHGHLVGINTAIFSKSGGADGIGFSIPVSMVERIIEDVLHHGEIIRPWLGIKAKTLTWEEAQALGLEEAGYVIVQSVHKSGSAHLSNIQQGDVLLSLNHKKIANLNQLYFNTALYKHGSTLPLRVLRQGDVIEIQLHLQKASGKDQTAPILLTNKTPLHGANAVNINPYIIQQWNIDVDSAGVLLASIHERSIAQRFGFKDGDIIVAINNILITNTNDLQSFEQPSKGKWDISLIRDGNPLRLRLY